MRTLKTTLSITKAITFVENKIQDDLQLDHNYFALKQNSTKPKSIWSKPSLPRTCSGVFKKIHGKAIQAPIWPKKRSHLNLWWSWSVEKGYQIYICDLLPFTVKYLGLRHKNEASQLQLRCLTTDNSPFYHFIIVLYYHGTFLEVIFILSTIPQKPSQKENEVLIFVERSTLA